MAPIKDQFSDDSQQFQQPDSQQLRQQQEVKSFQGGQQQEIFNDTAYSVCSLYGSFYGNNEEPENNSAALSSNMNVFDHYYQEQPSQNSVAHPQLHNMQMCSHSLLNLKLLLLGEEVKDVKVKDDFHKKNKRGENRDDEIKFDVLGDSEKQWIGTLACIQPSKSALKKRSFDTCNEVRINGGSSQDRFESAMKYKTSADETKCDVDGRRKGFRIRWKDSVVSGSSLVSVLEFETDDDDSVQDLLRQHESFITSEPEITYSAAASLSEKETALLEEFSRQKQAKEGIMEQQFAILYGFGERNSSSTVPTLLQQACLALESPSNDDLVDDDFFEEEGGSVFSPFGDY